MTNQNCWRTFKKSTAAGLVLMLVMVGSSPVAAADPEPDRVKETRKPPLYPITGKVRGRWSRVQAIEPGVRTTVELYKDQTLQGRRKFKGRFRSASAEAITLDLSGGRTNTFRKPAVGRILVDRPPYEGWITAGASTAIFAGLAPGWDLNAWGMVIFGGLFVGVPTVIAFLVAPKMKSIYHMPTWKRDEIRRRGVEPGSDPPADPAVSDAESISDRIRQQARQTLVRQGLPLDLSSLPRPAGRAGID